MFLELLFAGVVFEGEWTIAPAEHDNNVVVVTGSRLSLPQPQPQPGRSAQTGAP